MRNIWYILLICSSLVNSWATQGSLAILPVQTPYEDFPNAAEINAYLISALNQPDFAWHYKTLPRDTQKCQDMDCYLKVLVDSNKDSTQASTDWLIIPELINQGTFVYLDIKLVKLKTLQIFQNKSLEFRTFDQLSYSTFDQLIADMSRTAQSGSSPQESYYLSQQKPQTQSTWSQVASFWPILLFLPVLLLYP